MADIPAKLVKQLRDITSAGMMDCKKALIETKGNIEAAVEFLRKAGIAKAAKKMDREAKEGRIEATISVNSKKGALLLLAAETDFVAKNETFIEMAKMLSNLAVEKEIDNIENLKAFKINESNIEDEIKHLISKIGENIAPRKLKYYHASDNGLVHAYIHPGNKVAVLIQLESTSSEAVNSSEIKSLAKELAMQIAFSKPMAISHENIPQEIIDKEKEIYHDQAIQQGKPEKAIEKIIEGKLRKFLKQNCLLEQDYIRESDLSCRALIEKVSKDLDTKIEIKRFDRFEVGV